MTESKGLISFPSRVYSMLSLHETQMIFGHKQFSSLALQDYISHHKMNREIIIMIIIKAVILCHISLGLIGALQSKTLRLIKSMIKNTKVYNVSFKSLT